MATSVTWKGVTFNFTPARTVGYWWNGEPYVYGGAISVTSVDYTPTTYTALGGAMVNPVPGGTQGFEPGFHPGDGHIYAYDPAKNALLSLPVAVGVGGSIIAAVRSSNPNANHQVDRVVGLLVFSTDPDPTTEKFRPSYYGTPNRTSLSTEAEIHYEYLKNYAPTTSTPSQSAMEADWYCPQLPVWLWGGFDYGDTGIRPYRNWPAATDGGLEAYGVGASNIWSPQINWLQTSNSNAVKRKVVRYLIQAGLDLAGYFQAGGGDLQISGTHQVGFGFPLFFAAFMLNNAPLKALCTPLCCVELQRSTFFVTQAHVGFAVAHGTIGEYIQSDVGIPEWGWKAYTDWSLNDRRLSGYSPNYRGSWSSTIGIFLAYRYMGMESLVNWPPAFAYMERCISAFGISGFIGELYSQEYAALTPISPRPPALSTDATIVDPGRTVTLTPQGIGASGLTIHYTANGGGTINGTLGNPVPLTISANTTVVAWCSSNVSGQADSASVTRAFTVTTGGLPAPPSMTY